MAVEPHGYLPYNREIPAGGETALMFAARVGDLASAKLLVAGGANVNDADAWGISATSLAAHSGYRDVVEFLLDKGADPNAAAPGFAALHEAIMRRDEKMVSVLLDHGADANAPLKTWTPPGALPTTTTSHRVGGHEAVLAGRAFHEPGVMRLLLKHGADPLFVHHGDKVSPPKGNEGFQHRAYVTTALMAAVGMARRQPRGSRSSAASEKASLSKPSGSRWNWAST
jgi:ankyrin repeat protein